MKPLNIEWIHSIWYMRYIFRGVHKIKVYLKVSDVYKVDREATL